jgi:two-component system phosphate regulon sensor histidine kinase PhoR
VTEAHQEPAPHPAWPRLEVWLTEASAQVGARRETRPVQIDVWIKMAKAALAGDRVGLADLLSKLDGAQVDPIDVVSAQFELVVDVLSACDEPPAPDLWRHLVACQSAILAEAARLAPPGAQPSVAQLHTLIDFSREIVAILNPETLVEQVVSLMYQSFGYEYVHLFLIDATGEGIVLRGGLWNGQPARPGDYRMLRVGEEGIVGWVAHRGEPAVVPDVARDSRYKPHPMLPDIRSEMAVPLKVGGRVLGVLDVQSDHTRAFAEPDLFVLRALADQVAIAIENARLHVSMQRRLHEQTVLYETSAAMSANLDADTVLQAIAAKLTEAAAVGGCAVCQWDVESDILIPVAEYVVVSAQNPSRTWRTVGEAMPLSDDPIASRVLQTNRPALMVGGRREDTSASSATWAAPGWKTLLALPLQLEGQVIGLVELYDRRASRRFSTDEVQLCQALAHQTAMAMERIRLFNETRQRLGEVSALYMLANQIAANLNLTEVLDAIVRAIQQALGCRGCCIFLLDETSQTLEIKAAAGLKPEWRDAARLHLGEGIAGRAAAEARTVYLTDTLGDPKYVFFDPEVRSLLAVPMQVKGRVIGVINVDERIPDAFGPDQERLLTIAAAQAAIAIENARLFSEMLSEKRRTDAIIRYMADGLLMLDRHKVVVSCNPALATMLGMRRQDILGQPAVDPESDPRLRAICEPATVKERTGVLAHEVEIPRAGSEDGEALKPRRLRIFSTPVNDETGQRIGEVRVVHDVTKEREIDEMKNEFFSTISHELRTPLFSIQGFVRLILDDEVPDAETQREFLGIIGRQAEQLGQLVNNLLNISRLESGMLEMERKSVQLLDVLQQTVSKLQGMAQSKDIVLEANLPTDLPPVTGDRGWLEQVATNLVGNAIKFTPEGGKVRISAQQSNDQVLVEVSDTGIGIPADALDRIFDKFYRVPHESGERSEGTGLGLHIAKQIVELHDGRILAESNVGEGSTFWFMLPCG